MRLYQRPSHQERIHYENNNETRNDRGAARRRRQPAGRCGRQLEEKLRIGPIIRPAYATPYALRHKPLLVLEAGCYSLLNMVFLTFACVHYGRSIGLEMPTREYFTFFPLITVLASVPLTPGALGLREGLFEKMFSAVGVAASKSILVSLLVYLGGVICSLLGGLIFLRYTSSTGSTLRDEWTRLKLDQISPEETSNT